MKNLQNEIRIGFCKHTSRKVLQIKDVASDDALDEKGWLCLHDETVEEEIENIIKFNYDFHINININ